jgi:hypothetical protein
MMLRMTASALVKWICIGQLYSIACETGTPSFEKGPVGNSKGTTPIRKGSKRPVPIIQELMDRQKEEAAN